MSNVIKFPTKNGRGRTPLHVSHIDGKLKGSPHFHREEDPSFGDRMGRIKESLQKINDIMEELKNASKPRHDSND
jgi:hypothetical protein